LNIFIHTQIMLNQNIFRINLCRIWQLISFHRSLGCSRVLAFVPCFLYELSGGKAAGAWSWPVTSI
jgi:hypothetical protein